MSDSLAGVGAIETLERRLSAFIGSRFAVAMSSATSALHAALIAVGVRRGDEVIVPAFTWGGSITGVLQIGAVPVFADINETLTIDPDDVEAKITQKTKAVIVVHLFGHPGDCKRLSELCDNKQVFLIEDCAQALGARLNGYSVGTFGVGSFSFSYGKMLDVGGGGLLTTNNENIYDRVLYYTQHPLRQRRDMMKLCGANQFALNYRLNPLVADEAVKRFDDAVSTLRSQVVAYTKLSQDLFNTDLPGFTPVTVGRGVEHAWYRYSPGIDSDLDEYNYGRIKEFIADHGCLLEAGCIPAPLYHDPSLYEYLSRQMGIRVRRTSLPYTERACKIRVSVRFSNEEI